MQLQRITDVSDIQHNYDVLEYKGAEVYFCCKGYIIILIANFSLLPTE